MNVLVKFGNTCAVWIHDPSTRKQIIDEMMRLSSLTPSATSPSSPLSISSHASDKTTANEGTFVTSQFPGPLPIALHRNHLPDLFSGFKEYVVLPKTDGVRYLLLCCMLDSKPRSILVNRKGDMFMVEMNLHPSWYNGSLFDGENIECKHTQEHSSSSSSLSSRPHTFYIFDTFSYNNQKAYDEDYVTRMAVASLACSTLRKHNATNTKTANKQESNMTTPSIQSTQKQKSHILQPFGIKVKRWYSVQDIRTLWQDVVPQLDHNCDGLVLVRISDALRSRQNVKSPTFLKWKPKREQTVDFLMRVVRPDPHTCAYITHTHAYTLCLNSIESKDSEEKLKWIENPKHTLPLFYDSISTTSNDVIVIQLWAQDKIRCKQELPPGEDAKAMDTESSFDPTTTTTTTMKDNEQIEQGSTTTMTKEVLVPFAVTTVNLNSKVLSDFFAEEPFHTNNNNNKRPLMAEKIDKRKHLDGQIAEFTFDPSQNKWELTKIRLDRDAPNSVYVACKTKKNIFHGVELHELCC